MSNPKVTEFHQIFTVVCPKYIQVSISVVMTLCSASLEPFFFFYKNIKMFHSIFYLSVRLFLEYFSLGGFYLLCILKRMVGLT